MVVKEPITAELIILAFCVKAIKSTVGDRVMHMNASQYVVSEEKDWIPQSGRYIRIPANRNPTSSVGRIVDSTGIPKKHQTARTTQAHKRPDEVVTMITMVSPSSESRLITRYPTREPR